MCGDPRANVSQDAPRVSSTFRCNCIGDRDATIVGQIPRRSVAVEHLNPLCSDAGRLRQSLNEELMVAWFTRCGTITVRQHSRQCGLHDRAIGEVKPRIRA